jgi:hypothetical protein
MLWVARLTLLVVQTFDWPADEGNGAVSPIPFQLQPAGSQPAMDNLSRCNGIRYDSTKKPRLDTLLTPQWLRDYIGLAIAGSARQLLRRSQGLPAHIDE